MEMSVEKNNSAYMLFYERIEDGFEGEAGTSKAEEQHQQHIAPMQQQQQQAPLSKDLEEWIWQDNVNFIQDNNVFDHAYFK